MTGETARSTVRLLNLELSRPSVDEARRRLLGELEAARRDGVRILKVVHGYGSSGVGGTLRHALRKSLQRRRSEGMVGRVVQGERWGVYDPVAASLLEDFPELRRDHDLGRDNPGITLVELLPSDDSAQRLR